MIAWIIVGAILLLLFCILLIPMPAQIVYEVCPEKPKKVFEVRVWGVKIYPWGKNGTKEADGDSASTDKKAEVPDDENGKPDGFSEFMEKTEQTKAVFESVRDDIKQILEFLRKKSGCRLLELKLTLGFDDAAATGIAAGAAYGLVYGAASLIHNSIGVKKLDVAVNPVFNKNCLEFYVKGIFTIAPVHIIKVLRLVLAMTRKIKKATDKDENNK